MPTEKNAAYLPTQYSFKLDRQRVNNNGHKLKEFASVNELKITNTFFGHKEIHKMTWSARGYRSIIDYILTNKKLSPLVQDTKAFKRIRCFHGPLLINIQNLFALQMVCIY